MFSGIVESVEPILAVKNLDNAIQIIIKKPSNFDDLKLETASVLMEYV